MVAPVYAAFQAARVGGWTITRFGAPPFVPLPCPGGSCYLFSMKKILAAALLLMVFASPVFAAQSHHHHHQRHHHHHHA
jgi:predicted S18 family serine protease